MTFTSFCGLFVLFFFFVFFCVSEIFSLYSSDVITTPCIEILFHVGLGASALVAGFFLCKYILIFQLLLLGPKLSNTCSQMEHFSVISPKYLLDYLHLISWFHFLIHFLIELTLVVWYLLLIPYFHQKLPLRV